MPETKYYHELVQSFPSMENKNVIITGCTSGTGLVLAQSCGKLGANVYMINRASDRANRALQNLIDKGSKASLIECDLQSFASVREAGKKLVELLADEGCDVLCNNAGVMGLPDQATVDGFDVQIQTNHLSHFLLTHELWPLLERAAKLRGEARVINHSSGARRIGNRPITAKYFQRNGGNLGGDGFPGHQKWVRYQQSKLANLLFTYALHDRRPEGIAQNVKILTAHPGPTDSGLQAKTTKAGGTRLLDRFIISRTLKSAHSVEDGTSGIARCACEPGLKSAEFYGPAGEGIGGPAVLLDPERNSDGEKLLWDCSMEATGISDYFGV